ncbi:MAG: TIGR00341 family protein [Persicimonas sp.]
MGLRLIEMRLPGDHSARVDEALCEISTVSTWSITPSDGVQIWHILAFTEQAENVVQALEESFSSAEDFRLILYDIEATVPRPERQHEEETPDEAAVVAAAGAEESASHKKRARINIEELYEDINHGMKVSWDYATMIATSAVVAGVGIYRDDMILVIAAMIIAPLLHPNIGLSLATTLADGELGKRAAKVNLFGLGITVAVAVLLGLIFPFDPGPEHNVLRTDIGVLDVAVAGSAGVAGALSFTSAKPGGVVGVMIAVALLPPLVSMGLLVGSGDWAMAVGPLLLATINIICINLAGVVTFIVERIHPRARWQEERAQRAALWATGLWLFLLAGLVAIGYFGEEYWRSFW